MPQHSPALNLHAPAATGSARRFKLLSLWLRPLSRWTQTLGVLTLGALFSSVTLAAPEDEKPLSPAQENVATLSKATNEHLLQMQGQIQSINEELSSQRATLGRLSAELVAQRKENDEFRRNLLNELKALRRQNQSLLDNLYDNNLLLGANDRTEVKPLRNYDLQTPDGKIYLGEDEYIYIKEADATFDSRIDTGAAVSSISARNITEFERNGKRWYRFTIEANDHNIEVEAPFVRTSIIRQSSSQKSIERVVVALNIKVGDYSAQTEFTLTDRSHMQYPVLIGRTMIQDIAVVDVSRDHIQGRNKDTFLVLNGDDYEKAMKEGNDPNAEYKAKRESMAGQVAFPSQEYGDNLGPNSENALPAVRNQRQDEANDKKPRQEQAKANAAAAQDKNADKAADKDAAAKDEAKSDSKDAAETDTASKADDAAKK